MLKSTYYINRSLRKENSITILTYYLKRYLFGKTTTKQESFQPFSKTDQKSKVHGFALLLEHFRSSKHYLTVC
jgi:hypothetical protein